MSEARERERDQIDVTVGNNAEIFNNAVGWRVDQINIIVQTLKEQGLPAVLNPVPNASHTRDRVLSPPNSRCFEGTRKKVIKKIFSWINSNIGFGSPHIMWVYGYAGCGKSAIAQVIAEQLSSEGRLAASFFFFRGSGDRNHVARFATTIASQLAAAIPVTAPIIKATIEATPGLLSTAVTTLSSQFQHLVYDSFTKSSGKRDLVSATFGLKSFLIILDGLDECEDKQQIAEFIEHMIEFFKKNTQTPLRFLITSRVENHLYQRLHSSSQVKLFNLVENTCDADIYTALDIAIAKEKSGLKYACEASWPCEEDKRRLVEHIGGSYIFMTTLLKLLFSQNSRNGQTPMERLPRLLSVEPDFDSLYKEILEPSRDLPHFREIIGMVALAQEPMSIARIAELLGIETFPVSEVLVNLHAILQVPGDDRSPVTLWHTSLRDFLCSKPRAGPSFFAHPIYHLYLAFKCTILSDGSSDTAIWWDKYSVQYGALHLEKVPWSEKALWTFDQDSRSILNGLNEAKPLLLGSSNGGGGIPSLHSCAQNGKDKLARLLLQQGADPNAKNSFDNTPLHDASERGHVKVMQHLLEFGADPNIQEYTSNRWTPLHLACYNGQVEAARLLLDHNADPSIKTESGRTPLQLAHNLRRENIIALLHERGITK